MTRLRLPARLVALATAVAVIISCDNRNIITGPVVDGQPVDATLPSIIINKPTSGQPIVVGTPIEVRVTMSDNAGLASVSMSGYSQRGDSAVGTNHTDPRYATVVANLSTKDAAVTRFLQPLTPVDSTSDTLWVAATVTNIKGLSTSVRVAVRMTKGPRVTLDSPAFPDSISKGESLPLDIAAISATGVAKIGYLYTTTFTPAIKDSQVVTLPTPSAANDSVHLVPRPTIAIPSDAKGTITITPFAVDVDGNYGFGTSFTTGVRQGNGSAPLVHQILAGKIETVDSITIRATGTALRNVGFVIRDKLTNTLVDSVNVALTGNPPRYDSTQKVVIAPAFQGKQVFAYSFAVDTSNRIGYSVLASSITPDTLFSAKRTDTTLVVYGRTFALPRAGLGGDLAVDSVGGNVFVSNTSSNRLERWNGATGAFDQSGVAVGSLPWGMVLQSDGDTLLVANSGGTNISKVCINAAKCGAIGEVLSQRIQTRNTIVSSVSQNYNDVTGKVSMAQGPVISYSDRPQYVQQSAGGRLFYSTRPTTSAPAGTIRWVDPKLAVPDPRQVYGYARRQSTELHNFAIFNADSVKVFLSESATISDVVYIYDHVYGQKTGGSCTSPQTNGPPATVANTICGFGTSVQNAAAQVVAQGGDVDARLDIDPNLLALGDTTFVASSGDRNWIGFGEGGAGGRVMMVKDIATDTAPSFFSPPFAVTDLIENAAEPVFGIALDRFGSTVAIHGQQSYFATVEDPFHLRLQGKYTSFASGAGITFHPNADLRSTAISSSKTDLTRTAFVASSNGTVEVVDAAFFISRGSLAIKGTLYGPLRASLPFKGDDPSVVLKLFGLTSNGLVVINLTAGDIQPVP